MKCNFYKGWQSWTPPRMIPENFPEFFSSFFSKKFWTTAFLKVRFLKGTVMQIEIALINDHLNVTKTS